MGILAIIAVIIFSIISIALLVVHAVVCSNNRCQQCLPGYQFPPTCGYFECHGVNYSSIEVCNGKGKKKNSQKKRKMSEAKFL
jgi:hypothetical protein